MSDRVELQLEVDASREAVFALFATQDGLRRWLDAADLEPRVGGAVRIKMRDATATGKLLALDPPQHISFTWEWASEQPSAHPSVVAFDAIDHGSRTHVTLRHVGLRPADIDLHTALWRHWLERFAAAVRETAEPATS
jgi:uncharacterized protein YndB with AHSA1/START domain